MSEDEHKSRIQAIRRELKRELELQRMKKQLSALLRTVHPRPEVTGW